jgi:predicted transcriptional regulator
MGKLKKEAVNEIRRLGEEGYTTTEIADRVDVHRDTVRKYLVGADSPLVVEKTGEPRLSDGVTKRLYDLQGILSANSVLDALETAYRDEVAAVKFKLNLWEEYAPYGREFTIEGLIEELTGYVEDLEHDLKIYLDGYPEDQKTIAELKEAGQARYDEGHEAGYEEAKREHALYVGCIFCDRPILIEPMGRGHAIITSLLSEVGWSHTSCRNQAQSDSERGSRALRAELMR